MKKRQLFISLALALILVALIPGVALGAKPIDLEANGNVTELGPAIDVFQAGKSGRWVVASRYLKGTFNDGIPGDFVMTYKANVTSEEVGNLNGTLKIPGYTLKVNGKTGPMEVLEATMIPIEEPPESGNWIEIIVPTKLRLPISDHWTFIEGAKGQGEFEGQLVFSTIIDYDTGQFDIGPLIPEESLVKLTGKWQP